jgi:hypothetical protein
MAFSGSIWVSWGTRLAMHQPDSPAYNREDVFVIDDWR